MQTQIDTAYRQTHTQLIDACKVSMCVHTQMNLVVSSQAEKASFWYALGFVKRGRITNTPFAPSLQVSFDFPTILPKHALLQDSWRFARTAQQNSMHIVSRNENHLLRMKQLQVIYMYASAWETKKRSNLESKYLIKDWKREPVKKWHRKRKRQKARKRRRQPCIIHNTHVYIHTCVCVRVRRRDWVRVILFTFVYIYICIYIMYIRRIIQTVFIANVQI